MPDNSVTGLLNLGVQDLLKKASYDGNIFWILDLSAAKGPISGNKAWKLIPNVEAFYEGGYSRILTFGGAFSNHIYQTAKLTAALGIESIGMIRTDKIDLTNPTLRSASEWGMQLISISRSSYRNRNEPSFLAGIKKQYPGVYIVPEGGTNVIGVKGTNQLGRNVLQLCLAHNFNKVALAVGTGGTIAGVINGVADQLAVKGYSALKGNFQESDIKQWLEQTWVNWSCIGDEIFGGYAKWNLELIQFVKNFYSETGIITDPIYVGKMLYSAWKSKALNESTLFIHTGGQQGNAGMNKRFDLDLPTI